MTSRRLFPLPVLLAAAVLALAVPSAASAPSPSAPILDVAGTGTQCATPPDCGDGSAATLAQLAFPEGVAVGRDGRVYFADWGDNEVRELSPNGTIRTIAGDGTACSTAPTCGDGGPATSAELSFPEGVAVDLSGNVYIADSAANEIRKVSTKGTITRFAGTGAECAQAPVCGDLGPATAAALNSPAGVAVDQSGNVYIADSGDNEIRKVSLAGRITRLAGDGSPCSSVAACGDGSPAVRAQLGDPSGVAVDGSGNVYIADTGDNEIRKVSTGGTIARVAGTGAVCANAPACGDGGTAGSAQLSGPDGVAVDPHGNVYIADAGDNEIRKVSSAGRIETVAGNGVACAMPPACGDDIAGPTAQLDFPNGVAVDLAADVFIADTYDHELRWLPAGGTSVVRASSARIVLSAYATVLTSRSVTIRYALSGPARLSLRVRGAGHSATLVARADGRSGFGELSWNYRFAGRRSAAGRYTLALTAAAGGHTATRRVGVKV